MTKINNPLKEDYNHREFIGRFVNNASGYPELLTMQALYWDYLDWLVESGCDEDTIIADAITYYRGHPINAAVVWWLHYVFEWREAKGLERPSWMAPSVKVPPARADD